jgi:DNA polymerase IV
MWRNPHTSSFPIAIIHVDGDAFFASCEQAMHPELKGKPVVTGKERGIISAASYEAKAYGVKRGVSLSDAKTMCPELVILPSDYESYSLFSKRLFSIMRRYSNMVEEYGIEEGFIDVTGLRGPLNMSYPDMAASVKEAIETEVGVSVSVGLASTKVLAKVGSTWQKPGGLTVIRNRDRFEYLDHMRTKDIWGIGPQTTAYMENLGMTRPGQFARKDLSFVAEHFTKPIQEIWHELQGESVYPVVSEQKQRYASISKTKTFTPASAQTSVVYAQLIKNLENACIKARRYSLVAKRVTIFLKTHEFRTKGMTADLSRASSWPQDIAPCVKRLFDDIFSSSTPYRATGVVLSELQSDEQIQPSLFESPLAIDQFRRVYHAVDDLADRFGKHSVHLGASLIANTRRTHQGARGDVAQRKKALLKGESTRKRLGITMGFASVK